jgi:hypothetical protein
LPRFTFGVECKLAFCGLLKPFGSSKKLCFFVRFASKKRRFFDNLTGFEPPRFEKSALFKKKPNKKNFCLSAKRTPALAEGWLRYCTLRLWRSYRLCSFAFGEALFPSPSLPKVGSYSPRHRRGE